MYGFLRRHGRMQPLTAGALTGASLSLIVDEGLAPALGFSAPNRDYPALTHVRGVLNHLAYGAAVAVTAEAPYRLTSTGPTSRHIPRSRFLRCAQHIEQGAFGRIGTSSCQPFV